MLYFLMTKKIPVTPELIARRKNDAALRARQYYARNKDKCLENAKKYQAKKPEYYFWLRVKKRARDRELEFTLTLDDIVFPSKCPVLGIDIVRDGSAGVNHLPSIDRIDSSKGYTPDNIQWLSFRANTLKSNATVDELEKILAHIKTFPQNQ